MSSRPGYHRLHVEVRDDHWDLLKSYCYGGAERITASTIVNNLVAYYIDTCLRPRLGDDPDLTANYSNVSADIRKTAAAVAHQLEPDAFPNE
jgi:hypothetical protein